MARGLLDNFRKPDFNVAAFVRDAGAHGDTSRLSQQLQDAAATLEEDLRREIAACHEELLLCASSINDLDGQLGEAHDIVGALKASVLRVRGDVLVPFQDIKWKVELLERMQAVNVLIRRVVRFLWDARKLRSQMDAPGKDFSKAAHTLHELELLLQETGLDKAASPSRIYTYLLAYLLSYLLTYMHTQTHTHRHTHRHARRHAHIHACMHTYIDTYIHTSIHTYLPP